MTQEEKARRYDEAIKVANKYKDTHIMFTQIKDEIFPELAESEDERIRKDIIHLVQKSHEQGGYALHEYEADEMLAWLEKHNSNVDNANKEYWRGYREGKQEILDKYAELEKQCEKPQGKSALEAAKEEKVNNQNCVNPADKSKIKPKFKTGDRVIGIVSDMQYFITEVCDGHYYTESGCIIMFCSQDNFELYEQNPAEWSEEDEKIALSIEQVMNCASLLNIVPEKVDKIRTWLKSLRPQNTWKPSDEQMKALKEACDEHWEPDGLDPLYTLYQDLKKLIE